MHNHNLKKIRIFVASPSDVETERREVENIVLGLRGIAEHMGVVLEYLGWHQVIPDLGRPEEVILNQLSPSSWDLFIGILWHRFGSPSEGMDLATGKEYLSGTEEEFYTAFRLWEKYQRPRVIFYKCIRPVPLDELDPDQFKLVKEFFAGFSNKDHPGLFQTFDNSSTFKSMVQTALEKFLFEYYEKEIGKQVSNEEYEKYLPSRPNTLPRRYPFFGRNDYISKVLSSLTLEQVWGIVIDGIGGIGKTSLAIEVAYCCKEKGLFDSFVFVSAKISRLSAEGIVDEIDPFINIEDFYNKLAKVLHTPKIIQMGLKEKQVELYNLLRDTRTLLILDNLETLSRQDQLSLEVWLGGLPNGCKAIVTSRRRGGQGGFSLRLEKLNWEEAQEIIQYQAKLDNQLEKKLYTKKDLWNELYKETKGSPLALTYILGLIRKSPQFTLDKAIRTLKGNADKELKVFIFQNAIDELINNDFLVLYSLSLFQSPAKYEALQEISQLPRDALDESIERLNALSLLDEKSDVERFSLHPLTNSFVKGSLPLDSKLRKEINDRCIYHWIKYSKSHGGDYNWSEYIELEKEWPNIEYTMKHICEMSSTSEDFVTPEEYETIVQELVTSIGNFLWFYGHWQEYNLLNSIAYDTFLHKDRNLAGVFAHNVAMINIKRKMVSDTEKWLSFCTKCWTTENIAEIGLILRIKGLIALQRKSYDEAKEHLNKSLSIWNNLNNNTGTSTILDDLGRLFLVCGDFGKAKEHFEKALMIAERIDNAEGRASIEGNMGDFFFNLNDQGAAETSYSKELEIAEAIGRKDLIKQAKSGLAYVYYRNGEKARALESINASIAISKLLGADDLLVLRQFKNSLLSQI